MVHMLLPATDMAMPLPGPHMVDMHPPASQSTHAPPSDSPHVVGRRLHTGANAPNIGRHREPFHPQSHRDHIARSQRGKDEPVDCAWRRRNQVGRARHDGVACGARQSEDRLSATRVERERLYASAWPSLGGSGDAEGTHRRPVGVRRTRVVPHLLRNWPPSTSSTCTCALCSTLMMHGRRTVWAHLLGVHRAHHRVRGRIHGPSGVSGRGATPRDLGSRQCAHASARSPRCVR